MNVADRAREAVARAMEGGEIELVDVTVSGQGNTKIVTITVDKPGGVTVEDCATASNRIGAAFESEDPIPGRYRLDVQSPGLERPLHTEADFERAVGRTVSIKRRGHQPLVGTLTAVSDGGILVADGDDGDVGVAFDEVVRARTVLDWGGGARTDRSKKRGKPR
ncbi:MAG: ribosome maturation factor RimP [Acidimicrobiia bacterium]